MSLILPFRNVTPRWPGSGGGRARSLRRSAAPDVRSFRRRQRNPHTSRPGPSGTISVYLDLSTYIGHSLDTIFGRPPYLIDIIGVPYRIRRRCQKARVSAGLSTLT